MANDWKTFGHEATKRILDNQLKSGILPHAYLFSGPDGVGKKAVALEFAQKLLRTQTLNTHPDFQILDEPSGQISVERIRQFIATLGFKPFVGAKKVAIIDNAQNLNAQSGNALLKTLEEPSDSTVLILIASGKKLLPTIVSRCQTFSFNAFSLDRLSRFAKAQDLQIDVGIAALSFGLPGRLIRLVKDEGFAQEQDSLVESFRKLQSGSVSDRLLAVSEFADQEPEELERTLLCWYYWQGVQLEQNPEKFSALQALQEALRQLKANLNKKLVLQGLFLKI